MALRVTPAATRSGSSRITSRVPKAWPMTIERSDAQPAFLAVAGNEEQARQSPAGRTGLSARGRRENGCTRRASDYNRDSLTRRY